MKLYFAKGSSALAPHILLEETGGPYESHEISIAEGQHQKPAFLTLNPKGRVPVLETHDGVITENPAILEYIATAYPDNQLLPNGAFAQARARSLCAYLCATAHVAFAHKLRGARWATEPVALADMQAHVPRNMMDCATYLESRHNNGLWALGGTYSYCDPYLFLFGLWMEKAGLNLETFPKLAAHHAAMHQRDATKRALMAHGLA